ncbi:MAG: hypothetical protein COA47_09985 [Robiginitomaculum sp.]|nr:MAG: hypothetical protein COA47_09985 [Robiginitomaculum sp.]
MSKKELTCEDHVYKTEPYQHQHDCFLESRDAIFWAYLMEQGTGKSKVTIDKAAYLYGKGLIDAVFIEAPNGVHRNWIYNEFPIHCPIISSMQITATWEGSTPKKKQREAIERLFDPDVFGLRVLSMNVEALQQPVTGKAYKLAKKFLNSFRCFHIVDESSRIKTPGAKITKNTLALSKASNYRAILSGTPNPQSPFDLYSQYKFLDPGILYFPSFHSFKHHYGEFHREYNHNTNQEYDVLDSYKNLDELRRKISGCSTRVLKRDCLDLPEKIFVTRKLTMSAEQKRLYKGMDENLKVELAAGEITAKAAIVRIVRLQQILGGFVPVTTGITEITHETEIGPMIEQIENVEMMELEGTNNRIKSVLEYLDDIHDDAKVIIWSRFTAELEMIVEKVSEVFGKESVVSYYGKTDKEDRQIAVDSFQDIERDPNDPTKFWPKKSKVRFFIANQAAAGIGITLTAAEYVLYYSNSFNLEHRLQSEDRAHRIGQNKNVVYVDFETIDSMDSQILDSMVRKRGVMQDVLGDKHQEWVDRGVDVKNLPGIQTDDECSFNDALAAYLG